MQFGGHCSEEEIFVGYSQGRKSILNEVKSEPAEN